MYIEVQVTAAALIRYVRPQLQLLSLCFATEFADPFAPKAAPLVVDHVEFPEPSPDEDYVKTSPVGSFVAGGEPLPRRLRFSSYRNDVMPDVTDVPAGVFVALGIPVKVFAQHIPSLGAGPPAGYDRVFDLILWVDLDMFVHPDGSVQLIKTFAGVDAVLGTLKVPVPDDVSAAIGARVDAALTPTPIRVDALLARAPTIKLLDGGVGTGPAHDFVAFRFECGPLDDSPYAPASEADRVAAVTAWTQFYGGGVQRLLDHNDWSVSIDGGLLAIAAEQAGREALTTRPDLTVEGPVKTAWGAPLDPNVLTMSCTVNVRNACPYEGLVLGDTNVRVAMSLTARFDAASTDELEDVAHKMLRTTVDIARDVDDGDAVTCDISGGIIAGVTGAVVGGALGGPLGAAIGAIGGLVTGFTAAVYIGATTSLPALVPGICRVTKTPGLFDSDEQQVCTVPIRMSLFEDLDPALQDVPPRPGGLCLSGVFVPQPPRPVPAPLELTTTGFEVQLSDVCDRDLTREFFLASIFTSEATNICAARVLNDRAGQFGGVSINSDWAPVTVLVPLDLKPEYLADPYDCEVLVTSSTGVRRMVIPAISPLTEAERASLAVRLEAARRAQCRAPIVPLFQGAKMLPHKLVWEPNVDPVALELTEIFIGGLPPGEQVVRHDRDTETVTATATRDGVIRVFTLAPPTTTDGQVTLQRTGNSDVETGSYVQRVVLLTPTATLTASGSVLGVSAGTLEGRPTLITLCGYGADVYHLASPAQPMLRYQRIEPGLRGAEPYGDQLLTWSSQGLALLKPSGATQARRDVLTEAPVTDVARRGNLAYVLTDAGITVYDLASGVARGPTSITANALALVSTSLAVATDNGLALFDLADPWSPAQASELPLFGITALGHPGTNTTRQLLEVQNHDGTILLDAHTPSDPVEVSRSPAGAGLLAVARVGRVFARLNVSEGDATVYYARRPARSLYAL